MLIKGAAQEQLTKALETVNKRFDGNIQFNRFSHAGHTRDGKEKFNVTLRVGNCRGKGARLGFTDRDYKTGEVTRKARHLIYACWHVHGYFFDALPEGTQIKTGGSLAHPDNDQGWVKPGDRWNDWNIGSQMVPYYASEACECDANVVEEHKLS